MATGLNSVEVGLPKSFLYVPSDQPRLIEKAFGGPADALILELEDAVSEDRKPRAREAAGAILESLSVGRTALRGGQSVWVRVNREMLLADLEEVVWPALDGVFLPKCTPEVLAEFDEVVTAIERSRDMPPGGLRVVSLIESAEGLRAVREIVGHPRVRTLALGEVDLLADMRMLQTDLTSTVVNGFRGQVVLECSAEGKAAPVAPTSLDFADVDGFRESTRLMLALGFRSRTAIHPGQVGIINDVFTPTEAEADAARDVVHRLTSSASGVALDSRGRLIDKAVIRQAREILDRSP